MVVVCRDGSSMSRDGRFLVVCRSEYVTVLPPIVDRSILMCNQCACSVPSLLGHSPHFAYTNEEKALHKLTTRPSKYHAYIK
jgi:hypothetical protein